jgi:hypothetical protein
MSGGEASVRKGMERARLRKPSQSQTEDARVQEIRRRMKEPYEKGLAIRETETPKASQVMVSTSFPPPLLGRVFGAKKWHTSFQHAVKNDQHMMSHRDNRAFLATPWC